MATLNINGRTITGNNLDIVGGRVIVDGVDVTESLKDIKGSVLEVRVLEGQIENLRSSGSVTCGTVLGNIDAGMNVTCGDVSGNVDAGMNVTCGTVGGSVDAGMNVRHR
jgi:hypothetical protein